MSVPLRILLLLADPECEREFRERTLTQIAKDEKAKQVLQRILTVAQRTSSLTVRNEPCEANLLAEYLDHQLEPEARTHFENRALASDELLAELLETSGILAASLEKPTKTDDALRQKLYRLSSDSLEDVLNDQVFNRDSSVEITVKLSGMEERRRATGITEPQQPTIRRNLECSKNAPMGKIRIFALCGLLFSVMFLGVRHQESLLKKWRDLSGLVTDTANVATESTEAPKFHPSGESVLDFVDWAETEEE